MQEIVDHPFIAADLAFLMVLFGALCVLLGYFGAHLMQCCRTQWGRLLVASGPLILMAFFLSLELGERENIGAIAVIGGTTACLMLLPVFELCRPHELSQRLPAAV